MSSSKSWPDLVGKPIDEAVAVIKKEYPGEYKTTDLSFSHTTYFTDFSVIKLEEGSPVTYDLRNNRVRVFFDKDGKVSSEPMIA